MDRSFLLKIVLLFAIMVLLGNAIVICRDYQDSWVLEGLEIPFVLFTAIYALTFFSEKRVPLMVALAAIGRCTFLLIPNLKYVWFQGVAIDQHIQYGLANHVYNEGYIAALGPFGVSVYGSTPLIHLTFSIFSTILNIPVVYSVKYLPVLLSPIYPLLTCVVMKNLKFLQGTTALKYALFISSIPITAEKYIVTGAQFGVLLTFLILSSLVILLQKNDRRHWFIFIFFILVLAATHSSSSVLLTVFLSTIMLLQQISYFRLKPYLKAPAILAVISASAAWLLFPARYTFEEITRTIFIGAPTGTTPAGGFIPSRFFQLAHIDMLGSVKTILVSYGGDVFLLLLMLSGLMVLLLKMRKQVNNTLKFLFIFSSLLLVMIPIGLLLKVGGFRLLHIARYLFPIFSSIFILYIGKRRVWMRAIIFSSIMLFATFQLYRCQPMIPSASVLSKDLPTSAPLFYVTDVNTIYQRQIIEFARHHIEGRIACDKTTRNQITGLTEFDFSIAHLAYYYPLDKSTLEREYDCFLIHLPGVSGSFTEQAEIRTSNLILEAIYNSSISYTNGESYMLVHNPT